MRDSRCIYSLLGAVFCVSLIGCGGQTVSTQPVTVVDASTPPRQQINLDNTIGHQQIIHVIQLLDRADAAMKAKRLTTPRGDNALGYYRGVLAIMPSSQEAHRGLESIVSRYLQWADSAQRKGDLASARVYLDRAQQVLPRDSRIEKARQQLAAQPLPPKPLPVRPTVMVEDGVYVLDVASVKKQSPQIQAQLANIADQIHRQNARVQILAPTDKMGRWIYQQLNNHSEDFRIRANLKISKQTQIKLLN